jgi:hypothetical protein
MSESDVSASSVPYHLNNLQLRGLPTDHKHFTYTVSLMDYDFDYTRKFQHRFGKLLFSPLSRSFFLHLAHFFGFGFSMTFSST